MVISTAGLLYGLKAFLAGTIFFVWVVLTVNTDHEFEPIEVEVSKLTSCEWLRNLHR